MSRCRTPLSDQASRRPGSFSGTLAIGLLFMATWGGSLGAQERGGRTLEEVGRRIEALRPQVDAAQRVAERADALYADSIRRANQVPLDTIQVGPLRIATVPGQVELATEVFSEVWDAFRPLILGSEDLLSDQIFVFRYGWRFEGMYLEGDRVHSVEMSRRYGMDRLKERVRSGLGRALLQALPPDSSGLAEWVGMHPLTPPLDWSWIYRELASTASHAARRCYQGDLPWCWEAMGIPAGEGGWIGWYTPGERRLLVESRFGHRLMWVSPHLTSTQLLIHGCVVLGSDRACIHILDEWPGRIPLGTLSRASLVSEALMQGGEGAFSRLIEDPGMSTKERLAHAAGLPPDTLVARWRERVLSARPRIHAGLLLSPISMLFWLALLLYFARKSTSWRLG